MIPYHVLKGFSNGVMDYQNKFYPYRIANDTIAAKANVRYYVKSISLSSTQADAVAEAIDKVEGTIKGATVTLARNDVCETYAATGVSVVSYQELGVLCDMGTAITYTKAAEAGVCIIRYAEIYEVSGDYS